jgi:hypothetical protein
MNYYTVKYYLDKEREEAIKSIADKNGNTIGEEFSTMMTAGCLHIIDAQIKTWRELNENTWRKKAGQ